jgi:hypothetical protein
MTKCFLGPFFKFTVFSLTIPYVCLIIKAYFDSSFEFPIIKSMLSLIVIHIWCDHCFAEAMVGAVVFYVVSLHLKYKFRQIKDSMKRSLRSRNLVLLMNVIRKHDHYSKLTFRCNKFFKYVLAIVYFIFPPLINVIIYYSLYEVNPYLRTFYVLLGMSYSSTIFNTNYVSSSLSSSAHDFTSDSYSFLFNKRIIIPIPHRLKVIAFIEKLCGPVIGYYCLDLFPFTNYEFFQFVSFIFCNYFLLNDLIFNV